MTEWGPYNFNYPLIWNNNPADSTDYVEFSVLGPKGKWKILLTKGLTDVINNYNSFPAKIFAKRIKDSNTDIEIQAVYTGDSFVDEFGNKITSSKKYLFHFKSRLQR